MGRLRKRRSGHNGGGGRARPVEGAHGYALFGALDNPDLLFHSGRARAAAPPVPSKRRLHGARNNASLADSQQGQQRGFLFEAPPREIVAADAHQQRRVQPQHRALSGRRPAPVQVTTPARSTRRGRPETQPSRSPDNPNVLLVEQRKYKRLQTKAARVDSLVAELASHPQPPKPPTPEQVALIDTVLVAKHGVAAEDVPSVLALAQFRFTGKMDADQLRAPNSTLDDVRAVGSVFQLRNIELLRDSSYYHVYTDGSQRNMGIAAVCASALDPDTKRPVMMFLDQPRIPDGSAPSYMDCVCSVLGEVMAEPGGALPAGGGSDHAETFWGINNGVVARLEEKFRRFLLWWSCGMHALALESHNGLTAAFRAPQINVMSTGQYGYLVFWMENYRGSWVRVRTAAMDVLDTLVQQRPLYDVPLLTMVNTFAGNTLAERVADCKKRFVKCNKPESFRWQTQVEAYLHIKKWRPLLRLALNRVRLAEFDTAAGSLYSVIMQWLEWNACPQLLAAFDVVVDYLSWHQERHIQMSSPTPFYHDDKQFCMFFQLERLLDADSWYESAIAHPELSLAHFSNFVAKYAGRLIGDDGDVQTPADIIDSMLKAGRASLLKLGSRCTNHVFLLCAFGNPNTVKLAWEVFSHVAQHPQRPPARSSNGLRVEQLLCNEAMSLEHEKAWRRWCARADEIFAFAEPLLASDCSDTDVWVFVDSVLQARSGTFAHWLNGCVRSLACDTQFVESMFRSGDVVSGDHNGASKGSLAEAGQGTLRSDTRAAMVTVHVETSSVERQIGGAAAAERGSRDKRPRSKEAKVAVAGAFVGLAPSCAELELGKKRAKEMAQSAKQSRKCVTPAMRSTMPEAVGERGCRRTLEEVEALGRTKMLELHTYCYPDGRCTRKRQNSGSGNCVMCGACKVWFHLSCLKNNKDVKQTTTIEQMVDVDLQCSLCKGQQG